MGDERPSLYQMTKYTMSLATGGVILHDSIATPPATASVSLRLTATKMNTEIKSQHISLVVVSIKS